MDSTPSSSEPATGSVFSGIRSRASPRYLPKPISTWLSDLNIARSSGCRGSKAPGFGSRSPLRFTSGSVDMPAIDLASSKLRSLNEALHALNDGTNETHWEISNPQGAHAIAVGVNAPVEINIHGSVGYYCAGMNRLAKVTVHGSAGPGIAENMMSGEVVVKGDASQYAGATGKGGLLLIE